MQPFLYPETARDSAGSYAAWYPQRRGTTQVNTLEYQQVLGRRIAQERRRQGLSQPELAAMLDQPVAFVSQLERGAQPIDRPALLKTLADALDVPLSELAEGRPSGPDPLGRSGTASQLRVLLAGAHALRAMLGESDAPSLACLRAGTERAFALASAGKHDELAEELAELLPGLEAAARMLPPAEQADAHELTAMAYQACSAALVKLGDPLTSWVAADRASAAAEKAGNLLLAAAGQYRLASVFLDAREHAMADETARTTLSALHGLAQLEDPDALSLCGGLTLLRAAVAARTNHPAAAFGYLASARRLAARLRGQQANGMPEFGPQYIALYEIAVSVDLGDAGHALRVAATVDAAALSPGRLARMLIDVARAHALRAQVAEATAALLRAEQLGPCQVRDHDRACQVICDLLDQQTPAPDALLALARRMGAIS
jgi:transcriptional regulator with XRE-family HTH domain